MLNCARKRSFFSHGLNFRQLLATVEARNREELQHGVGIGVPRRQVRGVDWVYFFVTFSHTGRGGCKQDDDYPTRAALDGGYRG